MELALLNLLKSEGSLTDAQINEFYHRTGRFSNVFVINMPNRLKRLATASYNLKKTGLSYERFIAVNGKKLFDSNKSWSEKFPILRPGELGCLLSHLSIASLAANHPEQDSFTLIFEDDIVTSGGDIHPLLSEIEAIDRKTPLDLIYFGKCLETCSKMVHVQNNIYKPFMPYCTHAYAIRNSFAKRILEQMSNCTSTSIPNCEYFNHAVDGIYGKMIVDEIAEAIVIHPSVYYQDVLTGGSDLRTEFMINYQECNDTYSKCEKFEPVICPPKHDQF